MDARRAAGEYAAGLVADAMTVGLGTGSTVSWFLRALGERISREGLRVRGIPTSVRTSEMALELGIPLTDFDTVSELDLTVDGADEFDPALNLIKGGGGALLREKLVAAASRRLVIVADETKRVPELGAFPLPVEVVPFAWQSTARHLTYLGARPRLRQAGARPFTTDNGNLILDCGFGPIPDPAGLHARLKALPGVVETGLFPGMADIVIVGSTSGVRIVDRQP